MRYEAHNVEKSRTNSSAVGACMVGLYCFSTTSSPALGAIIALQGRNIDLYDYGICDGAQSIEKGGVTLEVPAAITRCEQPNG